MLIKELGQYDDSFVADNNSVARVHERTIPNEQSQLFGEVSANFSG
jgi:hypothetical protein